ncbi:MAG: hypothetical protein FJ088_06720, partial [Deltaproteobacteria bacterium]|nr:hypothetical protein [Deltaproteobacteria bacterium]
MKDHGDVFILGISALYHDSAACLIRNGEIITAVQEERFTRVKHDSSFPVNSIGYCIESAGITPGEISHVVFYEKPLLKFDRLTQTYVRFAPRGLRSFFLAMNSFLGGKLSVSKDIVKTLDSGYDGEILYVHHHQSHAASAFFPSPFGSAAG